MRVLRAEVARAGGDVTPVGAARARVTTRRGALLTLVDDEGRVGYGEASPLPGYSRESLDDAVAALRDVHLRLGDVALDDPCASAAAIPESLPSAAFALETALCDLAGQRLGVPLHRVLAADAHASPVAVNAYVGAALDATLVAASRAALARGITALKVKLAGDDASFERELAALVGLRAALGDAFELRLDANGAWSVPVARARLAALAAVGPSFVEQPVAPGLLSALGRCDVPWAADESLADADERRALRDLAGRGCVAVVLKPAALTLRASLAIAREAADAGMGVVVTHLFDGPVALAAACELALALRRPPLACGLDLHGGLDAWPGIAIPQRAEGPWVTPSGRPGLGLGALPGFGPAGAA